MADITLLVGSDGITTANSMAKINTNVTNLNNDKVENSAISTDSTFASASDSKIPSQLATKLYVDSGGNPNGSETQRGIYESATAAEITAGTATGSTGAQLTVTADKLKTVTDSLTTQLPNYKLLGVGSLPNASYENYYIPFGTANTEYGWTSSGAPTYSINYLLYDAGEGVNKALGTDLATGANFTFANTKIKIMEWDAKITADASTATSAMGFVIDTFSGTDWDTQHRKMVAFGTNASGAWYCVTGDGTNETKTLISTPSAGKHAFRIEWNPSTNAVFYVDGVAVATTTTNLPGTSGDIGISFTNGTSSTIIAILAPISLAIQK